MSILLQNHDDNRQMLGELEGIDVLLQQLAVSFKKICLKAHQDKAS